MVSPIWQKAFDKMKLGNKVVRGKKAIKKTEDEDLLQKIFNEQSKETNLDRGKIFK